MTVILGGAVLATFLLVVVELVAGYAAHSIALVSDALHNLTDVPTMVISWLATRWAMRPPTAEKTYGYHRAGILAAFVNSMLLAIVALFLIYESIERLRAPFPRRAIDVIGKAKVKVDVIEPTGPDTLVFAQVNGKRIVSRVHPASNPQPLSNATLLFEVELLDVK